MAIGASTHVVVAAANLFLAHQIWSYCEYGRVHIRNIYLVGPKAEFYMAVCLLAVLALDTYYFSVLRRSRR